MPEIVNLPYNFAREYGVVVSPAPEAGRPRLLCRRDAKPAALLEARRVLKKPLLVSMAEDEAFEQVLREVYEGHATEHLKNKSAGEMETQADLESLAGDISEQADILSSSDDAPVVRFINGILSQAVAMKASDIHIEPSDRHVVVRLRVDGMLQEIIRVKRALAPLLVSRVKVMAKLDIAEKRVPQDGHIMLRMASYEFDVRVSTIPTSGSERVVLRLLNKERSALELDSLGMDPDDLKRLQEIIAVPHGVILVTGPTGSGKTTTLYAALRQINSSRRNILTIEDPVELAIEGIGQTEVNTKVDMTFAKGLRAILRQDPDVIMVGEIRDAETARIAVQASLTGHLVFSTLHTNSAVGAATRLYDMGIEPFLLSSSLIGLVAQRLVRKLCNNCKRVHEPLEHERVWLWECSAPVYAAVGCDVCRHTGYKGRTGLYEIIRVDEGMRALIHASKGERAYEDYARAKAPGIAGDARRKVLAGITSIDEAMRVIE